jgi:catechol 2,3-dioxygenase-like lactoylglutathione lyase family enzyme
MPTRLDHTILEVHNLEESAAFFRDIVGLEYEGKRGPFEAFLISEHTALDLYDEWPVTGSRHLAFWMDRSTWEATFERIKEAGITYGDGPTRATNMKGPGRSGGVHGETDSVYFHDPNGHILEILTYERG